MAEEVEQSSNTITDEVASHAVADPVDQNEVQELVSKSQFLVNNSSGFYKELFKTLEKEQQKLTALEQRRQKLQDDMMVLKKEIEEEKKTFRLHLDDSETYLQSLEATLTKSQIVEPILDEVTDSASEMFINESHTLETCYEMSENDTENSIDCSADDNV